MSYLRACTVPTFRLENVEIPRILLGHNPFLGFSYLSNARAREYKERFSEVDSIVKVISKSVELGVPGIFISAEPKLTDNVIKAVRKASDTTGVDILVVSNITDIEGDMERLSGLNLKVAVLHGGLTDRLWSKEQRFENLQEHLQLIRSYNVIPGIVSHSPGKHFPALIKKPYDIQVFVSPLNMLGWMVNPTPEGAIQAISSLDKPFVAIKPLAMGRISPKTALEWVLSKPYVSGCVIGASTVYELEEDYAIVREIFGQKDA